MGECEPRNFLRPCLLLLLSERPDHGYELLHRLRELHPVEGDAGVVYRALRVLQEQGLLRSTWHTHGDGPARRTYQITSNGMAELRRHATLVNDTHNALHLFLRLYDELASTTQDESAQAPTRSGPRGRLAGRWAQK
jgi:PadR family transcriptional regulator